MEDSSERAALLHLARQGDKGAFDRLQRGVEPLLRRFLRRLLPGSSLEDDVLQNAFLALYTNLDRIEGESHLLPFLYRIVRNLAYDELRRRGRYRLVELNDSTTAGGVRGVRGGSPDEALERALLAAALNRALLHLPELQRQALILYAQEGLTYEQVAEATAVLFVAGQLVAYIEGEVGLPKGDEAARQYAPNINLVDVQGLSSEVLAKLAGLGGADQ